MFENYVHWACNRLQRWIVVAVAAAVVAVWTVARRGTGGEVDAAVEVALLPFHAEEG